MKFFFLITGHRSFSFAKRCIDSIKGQQGNIFFDWLYVDDQSHYTDQEKETLKGLMDDKVLFLEKRHYQLGAIHQGMGSISDRNTIVCLVDGDDYLLGDALVHVAKKYKNPEVAMTYGNVLIVNSIT